MVPYIVLFVFSSCQLNGTIVLFMMAVCSIRVHGLFVISIFPSGISFYLFACSKIAPAMLNVFYIVCFIYTIYITHGTEA